MSWKVVYSAQARQDLRNIYEYIAYELLVSETANGQTQRIMKEIRTLAEMPMRYRLYDDRKPLNTVYVYIIPAYDT